MAFQVSPGVEVKEVDLTNVIPAVSTSIGAFAGHFSWGPVEEVKLVSSEKELAAEFGTPNDTIGGASYDNYTSFLQASSFLKYGNALRISRACSSTARNAAGGRFGESVSVVKINNQEHFDTLGSFGSDEGVVQARCPGKQGNSLKVFLASSLLAPTSGQSAGKFSESAYDSLVNNIAGTSDWAAKNVALGYTDTSGDIGANDEIHAVVVDQDGLFTGVPGTVLEVFEGLSLYSDASKGGGTNYYKTVINRDSEYIFINEAEFKNSFRSNVSGVSYAVPGNASSTGNLFSSSAVAVGSSIKTIATPTTTNFDSPNDVIDGTYIVSSEDSGVTKTGSGVGAKFQIVISGAQTTSTSVATTLLYGGIGFAANDTITIPEELMRTGSNYFGANDSPDESITFTVATVSNDNLFDYELFNGTDGISAPNAGDIITALGEFSNPEKIDISLLFAEGVDSDSSIHNEIVRIAGTARKDCVGFLSPDIVSNSTGEVKVNLDYNSSYVVQDSSAVYVYNKYNDTYRYIPANGHIAGLCARTDDTNDPWFSPAGYNRGNLLGVTKLKWNPNKAERDELYKAGINPIISEPGQGILLFGDKTAQSKPSAFDRINVRRLFIVLQKAVSTASKFQLFELNDEFTRAMFRNMTEPFLRDVKGRRGITDFLVVCDETNNTGEVIDTNRFVADIYIKPARSINFITLNFIATRTGVEFSEIVGTGN